MKIEWLVMDVTAVGPPDRAERVIFEVILAERYFWPIQAVFLGRELLCEVGTPSWALTNNFT